MTRIALSTGVLTLFAIGAGVLLAGRPSGPAVPAPAPSALAATGGIAIGGTPGSGTSGGNAASGGEGWTGRLADVPGAQAPTGAPMTSASLVVPRSTMRLPASPGGTPSSATEPGRGTAAKTKSCGTAGCAPRAVAAAAVAHDKAPAYAEAAPKPAPSAGAPVERSSFDRVTDAVRAPFRSAGDTVVGWLKRW